MAVQVNKETIDYAKGLIDNGKVEADTDWSEAQPSNQEENTFLQEHGWTVFGKWHLALDTQENTFSKSRYKFPVGDFENIHRSALIAAKQRAAQYDYDPITQAADELLEYLDKVHS